jgi:hypothetical protein
MILIKGKFVPDPQPDKQSHCHASGQSCNINKGVSLVFDKVAKGDFEVAAKHRRDGLGIPYRYSMSIKKLHIA